VFRLRPTARQHIALAACIESHRELYNAALQERRDAWAHSKTRINHGDQSAQLTEIRGVRPDQAAARSASESMTRVIAPADPAEPRHLRFGAQARGRRSNIGTA
jgi:putative transposase